jgi:fermentation-respiration switch protein FrsA (DUF1100 family)
VSEVPPPLAPLFRPTVQPFLMSLLSIDPAAEVAALSQPVLLLHGARDIQIMREDFDALAKARPDARALVFSNMNHALKSAPADREGNIKAYTDPTLALDAHLVATIAEFVHSLA